MQVFKQQSMEVEDSDFGIYCLCNTSVCEECYSTTSVQMTESWKHNKYQNLRRKKAERKNPGSSLSITINKIVAE